MTKLLVVASSLDLRAPLSSTPSWWQLLKALAEQGVELVVAPYQGPAIESPWWTAAANPCQREGDTVGWIKRLAPARRAASAAQDPVSDRLARSLVERVTKPRWRKHLYNLVEVHRDFDALLFLTVPPNHFGSIPTGIDKKFGLPTYLHDGDVPASLPRFAGFRTGFRIYQGADLSEYAGVFSSSKGGVEDLVRLGARNVRVLYYGADPALFAHPPVDQDIDVFFYGHGSEYREEWIAMMLAAPSRQLQGARFAVRGTRLGLMPRVEQLPYASFSKLSEYCSRSRINLLITRQAHASVYASSTARPFELAALGCAMVSNPYLGVEEWFEPGREILTVNNTHEAIETYRALLNDAATRRELGANARKRLVERHTYQHRAKELLAALSGSQFRPMVTEGVVR
ncbi:MAG: glycosyltransferase [Chloroflexota bacterium]|nr:glycosyltransferase [Chloroflexota bacterium]